MPKPAERFDHARHEMDAARRDLEAALAALDPALWSERPAPGRWSVAEVLEHLLRVETRVLERMERGLAALPPAPDWRRFFHLPVSWAEWRGVRVKTSPPFEPQAAAVSGEALLGDLRALREQLCRLLDAQRERDLRGLCARHPFLGFLDGYGWMAFLAVHERRHLQQIQEGVAALRARAAGGRLTR